MSFISIAFLFFFVAIVAAYYLCPARWRWLVLLIGSCYFYMAFVPQYLLVLFTIIILDFFLARRIEQSTGRTRRLYLTLSILSNIGILFVFKYFNFFNANIALVAHLVDWNYAPATLRLLLPLGLSFHTFQSLSYIIEVYRGKYPASRHLGVYALYVMFFPQLVAGPIERPQHLLEQLKSLNIRFSPTRIVSGLRLMVWGLFKKVVIADRLAVAVTYVWAHAAHLPGPSMVLAAIFFAFQLYTDFGGYSDIARGSARVLGIDVVRNFEQPFYSRSTAEYWRRWHISLSTWFRDYFYYPLVYSTHRITRAWLYACVLITFLVTGLWHGAGWTYIIMGGLFGMYIVVGQATKAWRDRAAHVVGLDMVPRVRAALQMLTTFILAGFADIFFRAPSLHEALLFIRDAGSGWGMSVARYWDAYIVNPFDYTGFTTSEFLLSIALIVFLMIVDFREQHQRLGALFDAQSLWRRSMLYTSVVLAVVLLGVYGQTAFIYFQF